MGKPKNDEDDVSRGCESFKDVLIHISAVELASDLNQLDHAQKIGYEVENRTNVRHIVEAKYERGFIKDRITGDIRSPLEELDLYVAQNPGAPVSGFILDRSSEFAAELHRQLTESPMPKAAPALWADAKLEGDTPPVFIKRHYEPWLGKGLNRSHVKAVDPELYSSLMNYLRRHPMPDDVELPSRKEVNDRMAENVARGEKLSFGEISAREAGRISMALHRRRSQER